MAKPNKVIYQVSTGDAKKWENLISLRMWLKLGMIIQCMPPHIKIMWIQPMHKSSYLTKRGETKNIWVNSKIEGW